MSEALILALIQFAIRFGLPAAVAFFQRLGSGPTLDDAIAALALAHTKSLEDYIRLDAEATAAKLRALTSPPAPPA